jgi:glycosyltransferase involved in cell wall biosynthesis
MTASSPAHPLRIAQMLESDGPGGAETMLVSLSEALRSRGHEVCPVGPAHGVGWLSARLKNEGFERETFTIRRPIDWRCVRGLIQVLRARRIEVVHSHEFTMAVYGAAAARWLGIPHVITMHGSQYVTSKRRRRIALRWAFRSSAHVVGVSNDTTAHLTSRLGLSRDVIQTIPNGVPYRPGNRAATRRALGVEDHEILVLAVGNLIVRKGHAQLIRALASAHPEPDVPWRLAIAGQGDQRDRLRAIAEEHGVSGRVNLLGQRSDVFDLHAASDIFVMPSLWEGLPLALLEAMHAGTAIVASRTSGIPEAITDNVDGLLTPPGDEIALRDALTRLLPNANERARLGAAALARARAQFSMDRMTDQYEALYRTPG